MGAYGKPLRGRSLQLMSPGSTPSRRLSVPPGLPSISQGDAATAFVSHAPSVAWMKDAEGRYVVASPAFHRRFGLECGAALGKTDLDVFPPSVAQQIRDADDEVRAASGCVQKIEQDHGPHDQFRHWLVTRFPLVVGGVPHVGGLAIDVTTYRRDQQQAEGMFHQVLDAISDVVIVRGPQSKIQWANRAFLEIYGIGKDQLEFVLDASFNAPDYTQRLVRDDVTVFTTGRTLEIPDERVQHYDGRVLQFHTVKSPILDASGAVTNTVSVSRDITDKNRLEAELRQAQKLESVGRLAGGIAHEINTPIQFVSDQAHFLNGAFADLLALCGEYRSALDKARSGAPSPEDFAQVRAAEEAADLEFLRENGPAAIAAILDGTGRVSRLVRAMKEFGHPDNGTKESTDINRALGNTITIAAAETKGLATVETNFGDLPPVWCYSSDLNQVFLNLFVNAAHAIGDVVKGTGHLGRIAITSRHDDGVVTVSISDTGGGIPEDIHAKIFEPFFTTKEVGRGTGQGLAISRMIVVEKHGGTLTFTTEVGRGTTFHVRLPVGEEERQGQFGPGSTPGVAGSERSGSADA
jgi:two-component system NtrC family sensor kinase